MSRLKGDDFLNRYRIKAILTTQSPLVIGSGEESNGKDVYSPKELEKINNQIQEGKISKVPMVSTVMKDGEGKPYIPGSSIRGVVRNWLRSILISSGEDWIKEQDYEEIRKNEEDDLDSLRKFSAFELLFGTSLQEGKIEIWDAPCITSLNDNSKKITGINTSVVIDPVTGTAIDKLLFKYEYVPKGVSFELNITAQNLEKKELGLILFMLNGFNSFIYPIQIGANGSIGFGRMICNDIKIFKLDHDNFSDWFIESIKHIGEEPSCSSGFSSLIQLNETEQQKLIEFIKDDLKKSYKVQ